jgi:acyl-CoA reductase-like NAD-dependent aldehyde dehydrogenase
VGAVTHPPQLDIIAGHVEDAKAKGATVLTGGRPGAGPGRFWEPTVITGVDHGMTCMQEETFGPTLPIMRVADVDEAVRLANDSVYGLQASVFTKDLEKGEAIARRLQCGAVVVNDAQVNYAVFDAPMGGWKTSGVGSRHGASGIRKFCHTQSIVVIGLALHKELHHFPLTTRGSKLMSGLVAKLYGR